MMRSLKISEETDFQLETLKLMLVQRLKRKITKGQAVRFALRTLAEKMELIGEVKKDGDE